MSWHESSRQMASPNPAAISRFAPRRRRPLLALWAHSTPCTLWALCRSRKFETPRNSTRQILTQYFHQVLNFRASLNGPGSPVPSYVQFVVERVFELHIRSALAGGRRCCPACPGRHRVVFHSLVFGRPDACAAEAGLDAVPGFAVDAEQAACQYFPDGSLGGVPCLTPLGKTERPPPPAEQGR